MRTKQIFLFHCRNSDYFALSDARWCARRLPKNFAEGRWLLIRSIVAAEHGAAYFEAARLVAKRHICILHLNWDRFEFKCCCSTAASTYPEEAGLIDLAQRFSAPPKVRAGKQLKLH